MIDQSLLNPAHVARIDFLYKEDFPRKTPMLIFFRADGAVLYNKICSSDQEVELLKALLVGSLGGYNEVFGM
jgi:hypothetical protein